VTELTRDLYCADPDRRLEASNALKLLERFASPDAFVAVSFLERLRDNANRPRSTWLSEIEEWDQLRAAPSHHLPTSRLREESIEEQALRRRRREAVVVNEGDHPLTQQDIIQRQPSFPASDRQPTQETENRSVERPLEVIASEGHIPTEERMIHLDETENGEPAETVHTYGE
jgi:hypothetical protein